MHCLEVIVKRNDEAAGREAAHAVNDGAHAADVFAPLLDYAVNPGSSKAAAFKRGYLRGREEG